MLTFWVYIKKDSILSESTSCSFKSSMLAEVSKSSSIVMVRSGFLEALLGIRSWWWQIAVWVSRTGGWWGRPRRSRPQKTHMKRHTLVEISTRRRTQTVASSTTREPTTFQAGRAIWQRASGSPGFLSSGWWDDCQQVGWPPRCQEARSRAHTNTHRRGDEPSDEGGNRRKQETNEQRWAQATCGRKATVSCTCAWCQLCFVIPPTNSKDSSLIPPWQEGRKPGMEPQRRCEETHGMSGLQTVSWAPAAFSLQEDMPDYCMFGKQGHIRFPSSMPSLALGQAGPTLRDYLAALSTVSENSGVLQLKSDKTGAASAALLRLPHYPQSSLRPVWNLLLLWRLSPSRLRAHSVAVSGLALGTGWSTFYKNPASQPEFLDRNFVSRRLVLVALNPHLSAEAERPHNLCPLSPSTLLTSFLCHM